jgi:hypothetical protein
MNYLMTKDGNESQNDNDEDGSDEMSENRNDEA